jgi:Fe2+ or Zn2+ uptake regulation protein
VSAPMAEALTGASRAAVQRNLAWMEARGLIREVTGQGRFRMWRIVEARAVESRSILGARDGVLTDDLFEVLKQ